MSYHIRIEYGINDGEFGVNLTEEELKTHYVIPFLNGENLMINGREIIQQGIKRVKIFSGPIELAINKIKYKDQSAPPLKKLQINSVEWRAMDLLFDVTNKYLTRPPVKKEIVETVAVAVSDSDKSEYIHQARIEELKRIKNKSFDLSKLIKLCEEINDNWKMNNYYSVIALLRTIIHHVPTIFGFATFEQVTNNYSKSSFKKVCLTLLNSSKNIADSHLHGQAQKNEVLPNERQVDFRPDLDFLLSEVISITK